MPRLALALLMQTLLSGLGMAASHSKDPTRCTVSDLGPTGSEVWDLPEACRALDASSAAIGEEGALRLAAAIDRAPTRLVALNLTWCSIGMRGLRALLGSLSRGGTVVSLDLSSNWLGSLAVGGDWIGRLELSRLRSLRELRLRWNALGAQSGASLGALLLSLPKLRVLDLGGNALSASGSAPIAQALRAHSSLAELHMDYNVLGEAGVGHFGKALRESHSLRLLDLSGNYMNDAGAALIATGLQDNSGLQALRLASNEYIGDNGAQMLAGAIRGHPRLRQLELSGNRVGDRGASQLISSLKANQVLQHLSLSDNALRRSYGRGVSPSISTPLLQSLEHILAARSQQSNAKHTLTKSRRANAYWKLVYPQRRGSYAKARTAGRPPNFFYRGAPPEIMGPPCEQHAWSECRLDNYFKRGKTPPLIQSGASFAPFRLPPASCMRNLFTWNASQADWEAAYAYSAGAADNTWAEVAHTREQTGGAWLYLTEGSGLFWNCGRSLRARNKVAAAVALLREVRNISLSQALNDLARGIQEDDPAMCGTDHCRTFMRILLSNRTDRNDNCYGGCRLAQSPLRSWLRRAAFGAASTEWRYDHMSASSVFDHGLTKWARRLNYDSVQLTMQPQVWCGIGWTTELLDLRVRAHRITDIIPHLSLRDPQRPQVGTPCLVRRDNASRKAFQYCIYCEGSLMERTSRCLHDANLASPSGAKHGFTIYSQYHKDRFDSCVGTDRPRGRVADGFVLG